MPIIQGLGWTFDGVANDYEKFRPGYPAELYKALFEYAAFTGDVRSIEVGIGGGQATLPMLQAGVAVTAVEPGSNFCTMCREKFAAYPDFEAIEGKFEDAILPNESYEMIYSASAFHWVPEEIGYTKAYALLKRSGVFARFANHPYPNQENPAMADAIQRAYIQYYYPFHNKKPSTPQPFTEAEAVSRAEIALKYGFSDIRYALFKRNRYFTAEEYLRLLGTYSDHIVIEEETRKRFFDAVAEAIEAHGGILTINDTIDLELARKV